MFYRIDEEDFREIESDREGMREEIRDLQRQIEDLQGVIEDISMLIPLGKTKQIADIIDKLFGRNQQVTSYKNQTK
jgi:hypothetical protein